MKTSKFLTLLSAVFAFGLSSCSSDSERAESSGALKVGAQSTSVKGLNVVDPTKKDVSLKGGGYSCPS